MSVAGATRIEVNRLRERIAKMEITLYGRPQEKTIYCTFCGKSQHEVRKLIAGPTAFICDECVTLGMEIVNEADGGTA